MNKTYFQQVSKTVWVRIDNLFAGKRTYGVRTECPGFHKNGKRSHFASHERD